MKTQKLNFTNLKNSKVVNNILKGVVGIFAVATFVSCVEDGEGLEQEVAQPDGVALNERFQDNRDDALQVFVVDASAGGVITGSQGTTVTFPPNSFGDNGSPVSGNVTVELIEIYDKASMLLKNRSTLGMKANGDKEALKSAGEFFINAKQGVNELELLAMASVQSRPVDFVDLDGGMKIFRGPDQDCDGIDDDCDWVEADEDENGETDDAKIRDGQGANGEFATYNYDIGSLGWTNLDRWYNYTGSKTEIYIDVPAEFDQDNCAVYLSYDGEPTALARMDVYDTNLEMFTEHYGLIPVGLEVHIIMVSEIDGQLHYAIQGTTIVDGHIEVIAGLSPISQPALESLINSLP